MQNREMGYKGKFSGGKARAGDVSMLGQCLPKNPSCLTGSALDIPASSQVYWGLSY
jgi:hypothetical protein